MLAAKKREAEERATAEAAAARERTAAAEEARLRAAAEAGAACGRRSCRRCWLQRMCLGLHPIVSEWNHATPASNRFSVQRHICTWSCDVLADGNAARSSGGLFGSSCTADEGLNASTGGRGAVGGGSGRCASQEPQEAPAAVVRAAAR